MLERQSSGARAGPSGEHAPPPAGSRKRKAAFREAVSKFKRGAGVSTKGMADKKQRGKLSYTDQLAEDASIKSAKVGEWLMPSEAGSLEAEGMERTFKFKQSDIVEAVDVGAAAKVFDIKLPELGPYMLDFTTSGRYAALGGRKGHLALMDWSKSSLIAELQVQETVRAVQMLHNEMFFAAAQKRHVYIYDKRGIEVHRASEHTNIHAMQFMPRHFMLATIGEQGVLKYQDTSTGRLVAQHKTKLGHCQALRLNTWNGVLNCGHANGTVTLWSPNLGTPLVKILTHRGPVAALAVDPSGQRLVTAGLDRCVKVWDLRTYKELHTYHSFAPAQHLDISQRGYLAVGTARKVQVWKDALSEKVDRPYMSHPLPFGTLSSMRFCPYEDVLGIGSSLGLSSMLAPGVGEPNYDSWVANPFQNKRERQNQEVAHLLDKLQPDSIVLDPTSVAQVRREPAQVVEERRLAGLQARAAATAQEREKNDSKKKMKGKNKPTRRSRKKQNNVIEDKRTAIKQADRKAGTRTAEHGGLHIRQAARTGDGKEEVDLEEVPRALHRFYKK